MGGLFLMHGPTGHGQKHLKQLLVLIWLKAFFGGVTVILTALCCPRFVSHITKSIFV